jgi:ATP-binding cassette subfamily B protein
MLSAMLRHFPGATLLCVTHDVADTVDLDRVVVIERGRIVEQGAPRSLLTATHSRYRELLEEEAAVGRELWGHPKWRRLRLQGGTLSEVPQSRDSTQYDEMPVRTDRRVHSA